MLIINWVIISTDIQRIYVHGDDVKKVGWRKYVYWKK
jgi:hypothetical protein